MKGRRLINYWLVLKKIQSLDFPQKKIRLFWAAHKIRPEEESSDAKSKSGLIISGWSFDKRGFLPGMSYFYIEFWLLHGQRPSSLHHSILWKVPWYPTSSASSSEKIMFKGTSLVALKVNEVIQGQTGAYGEGKSHCLALVIAGVINWPCR